MLRGVAGVLVLLGWAWPAQADILQKPLEYRQGETTLAGWLAFDTAIPGKKPGLLLALPGAANSPQAAQAIGPWVRQGFVVLTMDLFGAGIAPRDARDAMTRAGAGSKDRALLRERASAALDTLARQPNVDRKRLAGIGYGVGGTALLELARAGADLEAVVCVHGDLSTPQSASAKNITASILVLVGTEDPLIPWQQAAAFESEMRAGDVDYQVVRLGGAGHDFTNPQAGRDRKSGAFYDADATRRANEAIRAFLAEAIPLQRPAPPPATRPAPPRPANEIPEKALRVLKYVDDHDDAPEGFEGGRTFLNLERNLPQTDAQGKRIKYREWDVNPLRPGVNRGAERLVTGSDGSAYYTNDHYRRFQKIRGPE